jgi:hypothetical protein
MMGGLRRRREFADDLIDGMAMLGSAREEDTGSL